MIAWLRQLFERLELVTLRCSRCGALAQGFARGSPDYVREIEAELAIVATYHWPRRDLCDVCARVKARGHESTRA